MELNIERVAFLLFVSAVVALSVRRLRMPYSVGLVLAGIALSLLPFIPQMVLTRELVFYIFLPPLVFEAALHIHWKELRKDLLVILTLATVGVLLSAGLTAVGMHYLVHWGWVSAMLFGILIAATDPISVIATFKEAGVHGRLRLLVEAESLFNDSTAVLGFGILIAVGTGETIGISAVAHMLIVDVLGGIICGAVLTGVVLLLAGRTEDSLVEITFTMVAAYGSFLVAQHFHMSGVLASLTAGLLVGNVGPRGSVSIQGRAAIGPFWEYVAFVVNSLIFILIGMYSAHYDFEGLWMAGMYAIVLVVLGRALAVFPCCALFAGSALRVESRHQLVLFWGGLRGALALALSLGLPPEIPHHEEMVAVAFVVVAFSILVQGLTMTPLLRRIGEVPP